MVIDHILAERQKQYGDAKDNFRKIGIMWGVILDLPYSIDPHTVANMMIALKQVRIASNPDYLDSWDDIIGYAIHGKSSL